MEHHHLSESEIAGYVDHALAEAERRRVEAHLDACATCRQEVVAAFRVLDNLAAAAPDEAGPSATPSAVTDATARPTASGRRVPHRRWVASGGAVAILAAAAVAVLVLRAPDAARAPAVRGPAAAGESGTLAVIFPAPGAVIAGHALRFRWHAAGADAYRVTLLSESGEPVWTAEVTDTTAVLPDQVDLPPGSAWFWRVDALAEGRSVSTGVQLFRVAP